MKCHWIRSNIKNLRRFIVLLLIAFCVVVVIVECGPFSYCCCGFSFSPSLIRLTQTNIEEQVVASNLVHETNCVISMPEFALRLQISVDDPITAQLFRIFDTVCNLFMFESCLCIHWTAKIWMEYKSQFNGRIWWVFFHLLFVFFFSLVQFDRKYVERLIFANIYCVLYIWSNKVYQPWI